MSFLSTETFILTHFQEVVSDIQIISIKAVAKAYLIMFN